MAEFIFDANNNLNVNIAAGNGSIGVITAFPTVAATTKTNGSTSASGWTSLVAGVGGQTIRLWRVVVSASAATNVGFGDGSTILLGPYFLTANGSIVFDLSSEPWHVSASSASLQINNSNAVAIQYTVYTTQS